MILVVFASIFVGVLCQEGNTNLNAALEESEVLKLLRDQAQQHDKKIDNLNIRLNKELHAMEQHFSEMFDKIKETEKTLEDNLKEVEQKVYGDVKSLNKVTKDNQFSWVWAFVFLMILISVAGAFFIYMYQKATKHNHYL